MESLGSPDAKTLKHQTGADKNRKRPVQEYGKARTGTPLGSSQSYTGCSDLYVQSEGNPSAHRHAFDCEERLQVWLK